MSSMQSYDAESRTALGSHAAKKLRDAGKTPVTISKRGAPSKHLTIGADQAKHLAAHVVHLCKVKVGTDEVTVLKGEIVKHCLKDYIEHIDLQEVDATSEITVEVAVAPKADNCPGVKAGGIVEQALRMVKVKCPANAIPDAIVLPLDAVEIEQTVYASSLIMPKGVTMLTKGTAPVLSLVIPRWMKKTDETAVAGAEGEAAAAATGDAAAKPGDPKAAAAKPGDPKAAAAAKPGDAKAAAKPDAKKK